MPSNNELLRKSKEFTIEQPKPISTTEFGQSEQDRYQPDIGPFLGDVGAFSQVIALSNLIDVQITTIQQAIRKYRQVAELPDVDGAIDDIVNEAIAEDATGSYTLQLDLAETDYSDNIKKKIQDEFDHILNLFDFHNKGYDMFRQWYIDGRLICQSVWPTDTKNIRAKGILSIKVMNPLDILPVKVHGTTAYIYKRFQDEETNVFSFWTKYQNDLARGLTEDRQARLIPADLITYIDSGLYERQRGFAISYLQLALKRISQLSLLEDAILVYRIQRAPERRVFYIDVGKMPKNAAEQYIRGIMSRYKNDRIYNTTTGDIDTQKATMNMLEDFWLPRKEGKSTEVQQLDGGQNLGEIDDLTYFKNALYEAMKIPIGRRDRESMYSLGRATEIAREEIKFSKFISRCRRQFIQIILQPLKSQCVRKKIITAQEWDDNLNKLVCRFPNDNLYKELKQLEVTDTRFNTLSTLESYIGQFISKDWVYHNILQFTDAEIEEEKKKIADEAKEEADNGQGDDEGGQPDDGQQ